MNSKEKIILREIAKQQLEFANTEKNVEIIKAWKLHNAHTKTKTKPMVHLEIDTFQDEIITPKLQCETPIARRIETDLYRAFTNQTLFNDDKPIADYFGVKYQHYFHLFGHIVNKMHSTNDNDTSVGHKFNHVVDDLEDDWDKLSETKFGVDKNASQEIFTVAQETFGDVLPVKMIGSCLPAVPTQKIVHLMGMETMFFALYDYPDLFKKMMQRAADDYKAYFKFLENEKVILPTTTFEHLGQGSFSFTDELANSDAMQANQVWGFMDSQESVGISKEMFGEFIFPYYKQIAECFGLVSYGCCEPISDVWDYVKTIPNLRKVSISPWCNEEFMAEQLKGSDIIFHRKPSPNFLGVDKNLDEDAFRKHIEHTIKVAQGCTLEITQRDVYTVHSDIKKVQRYVEIIRESIEKYW